MKRVELLYVDGCPGYEAMLPRLRELLGDSAQLELRRITTPDEAQAERFLGSPTVRIDGEDVERGAGKRTDYGIKGRLYRTSDGQLRTPADEWVRGAMGAAG